MRVGPLVALTLLAAGAISFTTSSVLGVIVAEDFFGGALTTVMFAVMMASVDRRVGATQFTVLAAFEVWGKAPAGVSAGLIADHIGYVGTFALGAALSLAFVALVPPLRRDPRLAAAPGARA
jgi:hypothetical protein